MQSLAIWAKASSATAPAASDGQVAALGVGLVEGEGGVPRHRPGLLEGDEHVGAAVLHALELADGPAELLAVLGVGRRGVDAPGRRARRLGGRQREADLLHVRAVERRELVARRHDHVGRSVDLVDPPGGVEGVDRR